MASRLENASRAFLGAPRTHWAGDRHRIPPRAAVDEILAFMRKHKLCAEDLVNYGGAELKSSNRRIADRARSVDACWEHMARLGVKATDLDSEDAKSGLG